MDFLTAASVFVNIWMIVVTSVLLYQRYGLPFRKKNQSKKQLSSAVFAENQVTWIDFTRATGRIQARKSFSIVMPGDERCDPASTYICFKPELHTRMRAMMRYTDVRSISGLISDAILTYEWMIGLYAQDFDLGYHDQHRWITVPVMVEHG